MASTPKESTLSKKQSMKYSKRHFSFALLIITYSIWIVVTLYLNTVKTTLTHLNTVNYESINININHEIQSIFGDCSIVNDIPNYFQCPKEKNYYFYLKSVNSTNNLTCYWIRNNINASFWKCYERQYINKKLKLTSISECAVIFTSGSLLLRDAGEEIDSHSIVYRINYPPSKGFEKFVGNKTTYHVIHFYWHHDVKSPVDRALYDVEKQPEMFQKNNVAFISFPHFNNIGKFHRQKHRMHRFNISWVLANDKLLNECNEAMHKTCSSGLLTLIHALQNCNNVDLYGFSNDQCIGIHYYDDGCTSMNMKCRNVLYKQAVTHSIESEHKAIKQMETDFDQLHIVPYK
eukprot:99797_1